MIQEYPTLLVKENKKRQSCYKCDFFSNGYCIRKKLIVSLEEDGYPIFEEQQVPCMRERTSVAPWSCGKGMRFYKRTLKPKNLFKQGDEISHDGIHFTVEMAPGEFFMKSGTLTYLLRNNAKAPLGDRFYFFSKLEVEANFYLVTSFNTG